MLDRRQPIRTLRDTTPWSPPCPPQDVVQLLRRDRRQAPDRLVLVLMAIIVVLALVVAYLLVRGGQ